MADCHDRDVQPEDFYDHSQDMWGNYPRRLDVDMLRRIRSSAQPNMSDAGAGVALAQLAHAELVAFGTNGDNDLSDREIREALGTLRAICVRIGVPYNVRFTTLLASGAIGRPRVHRGAGVGRRDSLSSPTCSRI
jgi:hypothetical protein